jgi:heptosyltransferase-2
MAVGSANGQSKRWPHFERLCQKLSSQGHTIVICPGPGEESDAEAFQNHASILPGISIGVYAAIIAGADATIANDSGPMHIAAALGTPVLGIFGTSDPARTRPWGGQYVGGSDGWPDLSTVQAALDAMIDSRDQKTFRLPMAA